MVRELPKIKIGNKIYYLLLDGISNLKNSITNFYENTSFNEWQNVVSNHLQYYVEGNLRNDLNEFSNNKLNKFNALVMGAQIIIAESIEGDLFKRKIIENDTRHIEENNQRINLNEYLPFVNFTQSRWNALCTLVLRTFSDLGLLGGNITLIDNFQKDLDRLKKHYKLEEFSVIQDYVNFIQKKVNTNPVFIDCQKKMKELLSDIEILSERIKIQSKI